MVPGLVCVTVVGGLGPGPEPGPLQTTPSLMPPSPPWIMYAHKRPKSGPRGTWPLQARMPGELASIIIPLAVNILLPPCPDLILWMDQRDRLPFDQHDNNDNDDNDDNDHDNENASAPCHSSQYPLQPC